MFLDNLTPLQWFLTTCLIPICPALATFGGGHLYPSTWCIPLVLLGAVLTLALMYLNQRHHMLEFKASARWGRSWHLALSLVSAALLAALNAFAWFSGRLTPAFAGWACVVSAALVWIAYEGWEVWLTRTAEVLFSPSPLAIHLTETYGR